MPDTGPEGTPEVPINCRRPVRHLVTHLVTLVKFFAMPLAETQRHRFTAIDVDRMLEAGVLDEDDPLELLEGDLVQMSPKNPRHAALTERIRRLLEETFGADHHTRTHSPLQVDETSLSEPDVGVFRGAVDDYLDRHPRGEDTAMVVEIALTSGAQDRAKARLYAQAEVPFYWIVELGSERLEALSEPVNGEYTLTRVLRRGQEVEIGSTGRSVDVALLLP